MNVFVTNRINIDTEWKAVEPLLQSLKRGELLKYQQITDATGVEYDAPKWNKLITKVRKYLRAEFGDPIAEPRVGYRIPTDFGTALVAMKYQERAAKAINRSGQNLGQINLENLTNEQKEIVALSVQQATSLKQVQREHKAERKALFAKSETLPRIRGY